MGRFSRATARLVLLAASVVSLVFAAGRLSRDDFAELQFVAGRITSGHEFDQARLTRLVPRLEARQPGQCGTSPRSAGIVWMRVAEGRKAAKDPAGEASAIKRADQELEGFLACSPADPYGWLLLFHHRFSRDGDPKHIVLLEFSYRLAPHEGWLMPVRSTVALPLFHKLSADVQALAVQDLRLMARDRPEAAAAVISHLEPAQQAVVLPALRTLPDEQRKALAKLLEALEVETEFKP
jgi:hypothetical protein